ncbi:MAG: hydantoinase/oxoprolinase family protein [Alphaproteobacteria bacterium]|nr:hydantoinase/oxoprolinase family protein [Alphaproteobacteria bacterium]
MAWRIGVDSGGTFTDICLFEERSGRIAVWKVSSTAADPPLAVVEGVAEALTRIGVRASEVAYFGHGTTVATNALIQHRGARTGLITTDGFRDLLEIGRQKRPELYDLQADKPPVLVERSLRLEVAERLRHDGHIETPLDEAAARNAASALRDAGVEAIAICFLYSFLDPAHENAASSIVAEQYPEAFICTSHEVAPEFREYERLSTTVVNAYLGPIMASYIRGLGHRLTALGIGVTPHLTQSNGGVIDFAAAARLPVRTVLSGPSAGVVGAQVIARFAGALDIITFDMGGTSTDVSLLRGGEARLAREAVVHGYPIKTPMLDIRTVGAGGGSIAFVDSGGLLKVGPRSAGADPGPACYNRGNDEPTVTDANIVLQILNPTYLLGGRMKVRSDLARAAIDRLAARLGMDALATAEGIIAVVTANMVRAIRVVSVQRGHDPRDYTLVAFGGAGPLHAARLAVELEIRRVLVPRNPGILCATGLLMADLRGDFAVTRLMPLSSARVAEVEAIIVELRQRCTAWFAERGIVSHARRVTLSVDMRYAGQNYELSVPLPPGAVRPETIDGLAAGFAAAHQRLYGFVADEEPMQLVTFRAEAAGIVPKADIRAAEHASPDPRAAEFGRRDVWLREAGAFVSCPLYDRERLLAGNRIKGPAIVEQMDATTLIVPSAVATVDPYLNLILELR